METIVTHYLDQYAAASPPLAGAGPDWLNDQREAAISYFRSSGFPQPSDEDWRYTPLRPVTGKSFSLAAGSEISEQQLAPFLVANLESYRLVFVDGVFDAALSNGTDCCDGVRVGSVATRFAQDAGSLPDSMRVQPSFQHGFDALNVALSRDGYVVEVADNTVLDKPLEIIFLCAGNDQANQPRNFVNIGKHAEVTLIERHVSLDSVNALVNSSAQLQLGAGAKLDFYLVETGGNSISQINTLCADLQQDSLLRCTTITLGGNLVRNNLTVALNGSGAHCDMLGLYTPTGRQHVDNHTNVIHAAAHCTSRELYKGVLDQRSRAVFHGRIKVANGAQKTDATQTNNNLLLSSDAEIDTKPQLEIYADDVKCAHGATVGQMDENSLFYLRTRGIDEASARSLLTFAFVNDVLNEIAIEPLREQLATTLEQKLLSGIG